MDLNIKIEQKSNQGLSMCTLNKVLFRKAGIVLVLIILSVVQPVLADQQTENNQPPAWEMRTNIEAVSPEDAEIILKQKEIEKKRRRDERRQEKIDNGKLKQKKEKLGFLEQLVDFFIPTASAADLLLAGSTAQAGAEITELARALKNDPELIYQFVHDNIRYEPTFGDKKGAAGTLLDKSGNAFDQATLMVALLREAGFTASYIYGQVELDSTVFSGWLGTLDDSKAGKILGHGGIPVSVSAGKIRFSHVWVTVNISGSDLVFDPSIKQHAFVPGIDLSVATGYTETSFLNSATAGATQTSTSITGISQANIEADLGTYASNLINYINTNLPDASIDEVIGGEIIEPASSLAGLVSLPYQVSVTAQWPTDIPATYHSTLDIELPGIDESLRSSDIYGKRFTITFNGLNQPVLSLEGVVLATGSAVSGTIDVTFSIDHPYAGDNGNAGDQSASQSIAVGGTYAVVNSWGKMGRGLSKKEENGSASLSTRVQLIPVKRFWVKVLT